MATKSTELTFYVSGNGRDTNPGSHEAPFSSIEHAVEAAPDGYGVTINLLKGLWENPVIDLGDLAYVKLNGTSKSETIIKGALTFIGRHDFIGIGGGWSFVEESEIPATE